LGLAIPLVIAISTSLGAQNGLLVKDRLALERARKLDMVIFDKTGTLTRGSPAVAGIAVVTGTSESEFIALAAAVEINSEHPLAKAIVEEAKHRGIPQRQAGDFEPLAGRGAQAIVDGKSIVVGGPRLLTEAKATVPTEVEKSTSAWASEGKTVLYVIAEGNCSALSALKTRSGPSPLKPSRNFIGLVYEWR
jgi:Cu2+-exporting ATPase